MQKIEIPKAPKIFLHFFSRVEKIGRISLRQIFPAPNPPPGSGYTFGFGAGGPGPGPMSMGSWNEPPRKKYKGKQVRDKVIYLLAPKAPTIFFSYFRVLQKIIRRCHDNFADVSQKFCGILPESLRVTNFFSRVTLCHKCFLPESHRVTNKKFPSHTSHKWDFSRVTLIETLIRTSWLQKQAYSLCVQKAALRTNIFQTTCANVFF